MVTGIVKDRRFLNHDMGYAHPESPQRVETLNAMVEKDLTFPATVLEPRLAEESDLALVHTPEYIRAVKNTAGRERVVLDPDTSTSALSWETARLAAGGLIRAAELILEGTIENGFALVRPPGHHAESSQGMGFCLFNNIALAAEHLIKRTGLLRVLIVDWDLHHGNGTQHFFYDRSDVLFFSTHQYPYYPGSGHWNETGLAGGEGYTLNVPLSPGKDDGDFLYIYEKILAPVAARFAPEFILVSAGFDIYGGDPLGGMDVSADGFAALTAVLMNLAKELCRNRLLFTLEGGYNLKGLRDGVKAVLTQLAGASDPPPVKARASQETLQETGPALHMAKKYWDVSP